jgi:hypothetical protein
MTATADQRGDVFVYQTADDGDITVEGGITQMTGGYESAIYLSMFGGNEADSGEEKDNSKQYWGNHLETEQAKKLRSETQHIIEGLPATSSNLRLLEAANLRDLAWMNDSVTDLTSNARITRPNWVEITIKYEAVGRPETIKYSANWEAMRK